MKNPQNESKGVFVSYDDNPAYLENQWAQDTLVAFERSEYGEEGKHLQNLGSIQCHLARLCDANGWKLSDALKIGATLYKAETKGKGKQFSAQR